MKRVVFCVFLSMVTVTPASAALLCPSPQGSGLSLCYMVSSCKENSDGSASGGGYSLDPGRCVGSIVGKLRGTSSAEKFARSLRGKKFRFIKHSKAQPVKLKKKKLDRK